MQKLHEPNRKRETNETNGASLERASARPDGGTEREREREKEGEKGDRERRKGRRKDRNRFAIASVYR